MARFTNLQVPPICSTNPALIAAQSITEYEADFLAVQGIAKTLAPGDPVRLLLLRSAARESQIRNLINFAFQQNFIISAIGGNLDAIGGNYGDRGKRLPDAPALTTLQFNIATPINIDIVIAAGTSAATSDSIANVVFNTLQPCTIVAGQTTATAPAACNQVGIIGNGYMVGQITQPVGFNLPFLVTVTNTTPSLGGATVESNDAYAFRLSLLPASFSVAGPATAYKFWALTSNTAISDVAVVGPPTTPAGTVNIYPILQGGVLPTSTILAQVSAYLNTTEIRPMTDTVNVLAPTIIPYNIVGTYWIDPVNSPLTAQIQQQVDNVLTTFNTATTSKLGRTINPEYLGQLLEEAGASDYVLTAPIRTLLLSNQVGIQAGIMALNFGGYQVQ